MIPRCVLYLAQCLARSRQSINIFEYVNKNHSCAGHRGLNINPRVSERQCERVKRARILEGGRFLFWPLVNSNRAHSQGCWGNTTCRALSMNEGCIDRAGIR